MRFYQVLRVSCLEPQHLSLAVAWGNGTWTRLTQLDMAPESGIPAITAGRGSGDEEIHPCLFGCVRGVLRAPHTALLRFLAPGSKELGQKVLNNTSATTLCVW